MVKQRFLTHFKPWLSAVIKVGGADRRVSSLRSVPHVPSICAAQHRGCDDGGDSGSLRDRIDVRDLGMGRVVPVQAAQASDLL